MVIGKIAPFLRPIVGGVYRSPPQYIGVFRGDRQTTTRKGTAMKKKYKYKSELDVIGDLEKEYLKLKHEADRFNENAEGIAQAIRFLESAEHGYVHEEAK